MRLIGRSPPGRRRVRELEAVLGDLERRDAVAAGVDGEEQAPVVGEHDGALRAEPAAGAEAAARDGAGGGEAAVGVALEHEHGVARG